jgi:hypothetical protein
MRVHLSDESFAELLAGEGSGQTIEHLRVCEPCRVEAERVCGAVGDFRQQSLAWAAARPGPALRPRVAVLMWRRSIMAAAALLLVCAAIDGGLRATQSAPAVHEHAAATLADDNKLLLSIDEELNVQDESPSEMYSSASNNSTKAGQAAVRE